MIKYKKKKCPNCGGKYIRVWEHYPVRNFKKYHVECSTCHWCGESKPFAFLAVMSWNRQIPITEKVRKTDEEDKKC